MRESSQASKRRDSRFRGNDKIGGPEDFRSLLAAHTIFLAIGAEIMAVSTDGIHLGLPSLTPDEA